MMEIIRKVFSVFAPVIYGVAAAYLLSPVQNFFEEKVFRFKSAKKGVVKWRRALSVIATFLVMLVILSASVAIFIPQIIDSYKRLSEGLPGYIRSLDQNLDKDLANVLSGNKYLENLYESIRDFFGADDDKTIFSGLVSKVSSWLVGLVSAENLEKLFSMGTSVITVLVELLLSIVFAIYLMAAKEKHLARVKKLLTAFLKESAVKETYRIAYLADEKIGRYIRVQVLDSIIVGVVSYFVYWICGIPFYPMLALISGVTNIIPIFGPYIGAVPNGLFILLAAPKKLLPFIIIVAVVQILDGNVLVPLLQSSNMKMDKFWVLAAITVMGGFFGLPGMILGVPICAVVYILIKEQAEKKLKNKNLPPDTEAYIGPYMPQEKQKRKKEIFRNIFTRKKNRKEDAPEGHDPEKPGSQEPGTKEPLKDTPDQNEPAPGKSAEPCKLVEPCEPSTDLSWQESPETPGEPSTVLPAPEEYLEDATEPEEAPPDTASPKRQGHDAARAAQKGAPGKGGKRRGKKTAGKGREMK